jgi:CIC family chloride channel protein
MADVHDREIDDVLPGAVAGDLASAPDLFLLPSENIRAALARYDEGQTEDMPVLDSRSGRQVIGYMTEAYALKRYSQELERMRSAELGERDLFALGPTPSGN